MLYTVLQKREDRIKHYSLEYVRRQESPGSSITTINWPTPEEFREKIEESGCFLPKKLKRKLIYIPRCIRGDEEATDAHLGTAL